MRTKRFALLKPLSLLLTACLFLLPLSGCKDAQEEQAAFDAFIEQEFVSVMESDYTTCHVYLQDPESFGIDREAMEVSLGARFSQEDLSDEKTADSSSYDAFKEFERSLLTDEQKDLYDIYDYQASLAEQMSDSKFDYYEPLFESMTGLHYQLPTLFADWELRSEQDVKDLILLIQDVLPYVESALEYTRIQAEKGLLMLDLDSIIDYCQNILEKGEDSSVLASMNENIDKLSLDQATASSYKEQLRDAFVSSFLPAYQSISDTMNQLKDGANNENGLCQFENGREYYELLLQQNIGSTKSVEEVQEMMTDALEEHINNISWLMTLHPDSAEPLLTGQLPETDYESYSQILDDIESQMFEDFPQVGALDYEIFDINEEIASDSGVAAYFNIPPLDASTVNQLRVNPNSADISSVSTYSTVAHEGFPGHMYQYAYLYENESSPYRKALANNSAYVEGYAVYAQYESFRYLEGIDPYFLELYKENELASYCIIILADIGIHYEGWTEDEFGDFLTQAGFAMSEEDLQLQYRQLQANPCAFEPYYVGYEEISLLKDKAMDSLGDKFDELGFNTALLEGGNAPFEVVEREIDKYIEAAK